jgi:hypothetical protein
MKKTTPSKGDTVKVKKGCYKGLKAILLNRGCRVMGEYGSRIMWYARVEGIRTLVYEDEL